MPFQNCTAAFAAGVANIPRTSPDYRLALDADHDGIACENSAAKFAPHEVSSPAVVVSTSATAAATLPATGPAVDATAGIGAALLVAGIVVFWRARRRKVRFTA